MDEVWVEHGTTYPNPPDAILFFFVLTALRHPYSRFEHAGYLMSARVLAIPTSSASAQRIFWPRLTLKKSASSGLRLYLQLVAVSGPDWCCRVLFSMWASSGTPLVVSWTPPCLYLRSCDSPHVQIDSPFLIFPPHSRLFFCLSYSRIIIEYLTRH